MSVFKLWLKLTVAILKGHGIDHVYFDTEGRSYDYHYASVNSVHFEAHWFYPRRSFCQLGE